MDVEKWKISLSYEDENHQHKVLEGLMDRTDISYYELVKLIEEVGFSPAYDFLYYRKKYPRGRGYLVRIDNDIHVSRMISEHTNEKKVQLYVFNEEANIDVAPSDPQREDDGPITSLEEEEVVFDKGAAKTRAATSQSNSNRTVHKSKRLNVVQSRAEYTNGDCDNSEHSLLSRDSVSETQELEDNEDQCFAST
ncbi:uncharacterized protein [Triticum aestivum]|uniref:uncharacterized protein n=1 Tax=Triticum aestivum TaxID=4565 RepID=UPI001D0035AE|nr:uncharacterized protein LOC123090395 [Triticum aestivum]